ncbi:hypothetical protein DFW101_3568 [Solidesulfovibrio carbinoliphilus subsp. oakridgensis]|uniref:Uncharacterized protein n=1 Tax=Solidesulfovibrio carbinoliphilus subsp. oakridgensis TaxID=694327 RepID=G7Q5K5_9BACT|nr:hypothetical protein [Solidesulfovibrio carbinoliphilus]EHJ49564.1 hypothetical protein DFW101_3568 [Solidesulfovibrio carbinoliphilus subsp. oakridgensis]
MLEWTEEYDDHDNTIYAAPGIYTDECGSPQFYYRIKPILEEDQIKFSTGGTDEELLPKNRRPVFESLGGAKIYCEIDHKEHCRQCAAHQE